MSEIIVIDYQTINADNINVAMLKASLINTEEPKEHHWVK